MVKNYLDYDKWEDIHIKYIPTHFDTNKIILTFYFAFRLIQLWFLIKTQHFDVAHLHVAERGSFWRKAILLNLFKKNNIKVILHHHGAEFEDFYLNCSVKKQGWIRNTLEKADVNIVLSSRLIPMIKDKANDANVKVPYNAVKTYDKNPYALTSTNVLFLGRLNERKGVFDLLHVIKRLDKVIPSNIHFFLCGDEGEEKVKKMANSLHIMHRIDHIGWINSTQKKDFLKRTMINCLPSYNEGLPMTILETMAAGIPNVSTAIASIPEVISDGKNGFLISPGDKDALYNKLLTLINNSDLRMKFSNSSYISINKVFSLDTHITLLKELYNSLTSS